MIRRASCSSTLWENGDKTRLVVPLLRCTTGRHIPGCTPPTYTHREHIPRVYTTYTHREAYTRVYTTYTHREAYTRVVPPFTHREEYTRVYLSPKALGSLYLLLFSPLRFSGASLSWLFLGLKAPENLSFLVIPVIPVKRLPRASLSWFTSVKRLPRASLP